MKIKKVIKVLDTVIRLLTNIDPKDFNYRQVVSQCGTTGCLIGHWALKNPDPDIRALAQQYKGQIFDGCQAIGPHFAESLGIDYDSQLFDYIISGNNFTINGRTFLHDEDDNKEEVLDSFNSCRTYLLTLDPNYKLTNEEL